MSRNSTIQSNRPPRRRFRLWEKKRGARQTGSSWWGNAGEVIFFAVLFLIGVFTLSELITLRFVSREQTFFTSDWGLFISVLVLGVLITTGAVGAIYSALLTATSAERRAAIAQRANSRDLLADLQAECQEYPAIPNDANWKISPGVRLAYRLPSEATTGFRLAVSAVFTLLWNAAVIVLAVIEFNLDARASGREIREFLSQPWINLTGVVLVTFAGIGGFLIYRLIRQLVAAEAMGPTHVELSSQPLHPGGRYRALLTQHGHLQIKSLEMWLVCDEEVSFSEGTDTRSETRRVYECSVFREENITILPSEPFHYETTLDVPADAMHSFVTNHNSITWKLIVQAESKKWPKINRVFQLVMHPIEPSLAKA